MATTRRQVEKAIKRRYGYDVELIRGCGYWYFIDAESADNPEPLSQKYTTSIYQFEFLKNLRTEYFVHQFGLILNENYARSLSGFEERNH